MADSHSNGAPRRRSLRRLRRIIFAAVAIGLTGVVVAAYAGGVFDGAELDTVDQRFQIRGSDDAPRDVVVVGIDDITFSDLRERWPFRRSLHARAVDRLSEAGARVIAYDVQFTEPTTVRDDNALISAVERADGVVLATTEVGRNGASGVLGGDELLREIGARAANSNFVNDEDGVIRRLQYEVDGLVSFSIAASEEFRGERIRGNGSEWIDFAGDPGVVDYLSFSRLLSGDFADGLFDGRIAVVGAAAPSLQDTHATSVGDGAQMAGPEVQANAIASVLGDFPLEEAPTALDIGLIVLLGLVGPLTAVALGPLRAAIYGVLTAVVFAVAVQLVFNSGLIVSFLYPLASLLLGVTGALAIALVLDAFERERVRDVFSRFVPEPVVAEVLKNVDEDLRLGGKRQVVTVLFSDVRGFTTYSEARSPEVVIDVLNRYLTMMTDVILGHGGTLVTFMGDGIMAVFGAPIEMDDHADRALAAAREMAGPALEEFNEWMAEQGESERFRIGIGLNSGPVMSGNVGSERRLEYTVIGDTTNTASRIEGMTKGTPHTIYLADSTRELLTREDGQLEHVDSVDIRGRSAQVVIWAAV
ncbi:MAG TPA: adenylate/guanylate cyclase domain-containing protein [Thermoleophilaceae bacterium]|nr:adenylate/guanylate cyclase domain-containing protein [Thermoleophilaceae bacterium]